MSRRARLAIWDECPEIEYADLIAFLENPESYPHAPDQVYLIQTHASIVAVASPRVYKVKKPVNLGFLDFSTVARRKYFCEEEVRLNRRLCSRIYEGVVPIVNRGGVLAFGGEGNPVEYAVEMRELDDGYFLDQLLEQGDSIPAFVDPIIEVLSRFYLEQESRPSISEWGRPERLQISTDENFEQTQPYIGTVLQRPAFEAIKLYTERFYDEQAMLLERRCADGRILDCHGDLRAEHVHISPHGICIYDCIEFNERFRFIDVANDIAFLAMDLDYQGYHAAARYFVDRMTAAMDDPALAILAEFYGCYRAYVRGKVECMRSVEQEVPPAERYASSDRARRYFQLALRYAVAGAAPTVFVVMGGVGTGKSTQASYLSELLGIPFISSDRVRKELAGVPLYERGDVETRRSLYTPDQTARTYIALTQRAVQYAEGGRCCILDATFSKVADRARLRVALDTAGIPVRFVELTAQNETVYIRLDARNRSEQELSDARPEDLGMLNARYEVPDTREGLDLITVRSDGGVVDTAQDILHCLIDTRGVTTDPVRASDRV